MNDVQSSKAVASIDIARISSREDRLAAGKALRDKVQRADHRLWKAQHDRPDPISILQETDADRFEELVPIKYGRMLQSPFAFYRGAAAVMA